MSSLQAAPAIKAGAARLNLGCGRDILPGWVNLDLVPLPGVDCVADLNRCRDHPLPFADESVGEIRLNHVLEHIVDVLALMEDIYRIVTPGAEMTVRVPYGSSDGAWTDPTHVRPYFMNSWAYFAQPYYWRADHGYRADWQPVSIDVAVSRDRYEGMTPQEIMGHIRTDRNVVDEMMAVLRKVSPPREPKRELIEDVTCTIRFSEGG